jgi:phage major head subunit gpT-like protein
MSTLRAAFGYLLYPGFRQIFMDKFNSYSDEYTKIVNVQSSDRQYEEDTSVSGFGLVPQKNEGAGIYYDDPIQGYKKRYTHTTYGMGFRVTREMWEDDLYGKMKKMPKGLGRSLRLTIEQDVANIYNNGFDSTYTGWDGKELFSTTHPRTGGGTWSNHASTNADLAPTSLEQALIDIAATTDDRGLLLALQPKLLLVSPTFNWTASKILESTLLPGGGNNDINPAKGLMPYEVNHFLTDADAWFVLCSDHEVNMFYRRRPDFEQGNDFDTEDAKYKATARWSRGWSEPRGVYGNPGV